MKTQNTLQARRKELGLTYSDISERTGIPRSTIYDYFSKGDIRLEKVLDELGMEIKTKQL